MNSNLTIVKLGGSLITRKDRPQTMNTLAIDISVRAIARSLRSRKKGRLLLIHGGGSFGHYYASRFGVSTTRRQIGREGVAKVAASMITLHSTVLEKLVNQGVPCKTVLTSELLSDNGKKVTDSGARLLECLFHAELVPITFGNVSINRTGSAVISGDQIALSVARSQGVNRVIFATDVDGIYSNTRMEGSIIRELNGVSTELFKSNRYDVTGGIRSKIVVGLQLAKLGAEVFYVNGTKGNRLESLILGRDDIMATKINSKNI